MKQLALAVLCFLAGCDVPGDVYGLGWRLDPAYPVTPDALVVHVLANEGNCSHSSAETLKERLRPSVVEYRPDEIAIGLSIKGHSTQLLSCPDVPLEIQLSEPVGARRVVQLQSR